MKLTLFYAPQTCALVPYVTLTEAGAGFDVRNVNTRNGENRRPEFLAVNPKHKVPVLVIDGKPLTENVAIQVWIARNFPQAKLLPADQWEELQAISLMSWCASGIHPFLARINSPVKVCDTAGSNDSVVRLAADAIHEAFKIADDRLAGREFFFSDFTAADAHFFWCFRRAIQFQLDLGRYRNCLAHYERVQQRASVQKALAFETSIQAQFARAA